MSLVSVEALIKSYFGKTILDNISFKINSGDKIGLIGENGSGKTTLFKIIYGKETPDSGRVVVSGNTVTGYLTQEVENSPDSNENALSCSELNNLEKKIRQIEHDISAFKGSHDSSGYKHLEQQYNLLISRFESLDGYSFERNMKEILHGLNLPEDALTLPFSALSGGEKMRIALARILLKKPDLLLLDEPTNHLDINAIEWLEETLSKFKGGLVIISHDRYFLDKTINKTASIENKKLVLRNGNYTSFTQQLKNEIDFTQKEQARLEKEILRQTQIKQTFLSHRNMSGYHEKEKIISRLSDTLVNVKSNFRVEQKSKLRLTIKNSGHIKNSKKLLLKTKNLKKAFGDRVLFSDVSFEIMAHDKIFITGPNGCGKSTLFSLFLGFSEDFEGEVELADNLTYIHMTQHINFADDSLSVLEEIISVCDLSLNDAMSTLARFGFYDTDIHKKINILSGGERSRLFMACSLLKNPDILFLDEPTNHLDIPSREVLESALSEYSGAILAISHDRYFINNCGTKILGFSNGSIREFENYDSYKSANVNLCINFNENPQMKEKQALPRQTRAMERKEQAMLKKRITELEDKISQLEQERNTVEDSFTAQTTPQEYENYAKLLEEIEKSYKEYFEIN